MPIVYLSEGALGLVQAVVHEYGDSWVLDYTDDEDLDRREALLDEAEDSLRVAHRD